MVRVFNGYLAFGLVMTGGGGNNALDLAPRREAAHE